MRLLRAILSAFFTCLAGYGQTYTISTFVGGGLPTNIPGTSASLGNTLGLAVDTTGNVFFGSSTYSSVLRWDAGTGLVTIVAGNGTSGFSGDNGPATAAQITKPRGIALDSSGNLYITDGLSSRIRKVSNGVITTIAGNGISGFGGDNGPATGAELSNPTGIAVDSVGNLYIADTDNHRIRRVSNGIITTVAGIGTSGFSGDGGPATSAQLFSPYGVALDSNGNIYIADLNNQRVREVSNGVITTVAGVGTSGFSGDDSTATSAQLKDPFALTVDRAGKIYIADTDNNRLRKISNGMITTVAGGGNSGSSSGVATSAVLPGPEGVAIDSVGNVFILIPNGLILKLSNGFLTTIAGGGSSIGDNGTAGSAQLLTPGGLAVDSGGNLYIGDTGRIRKVSSGVISTAALVGASGLTVDTEGMYVSETNRVDKISNGVITTVAGTGTAGYSGDNGPATRAQFNFIKAVAADSAGNLYIADGGNYVIREVSQSVVTTIAGNRSLTYSGDGGSAISTGLSPSALALDSAGNLYVTDVNRIHRISNGIITTVAGSGHSSPLGDDGPAIDGGLSSPGAITIDSTGNLYIADTGHNTIRKVSNGVITTIAGNGNAGFSGDGGPATAAELSGPAGVAVDSVGNVYIADKINNRIRVLIPNRAASQTITFTPLNAVALGVAPFVLTATASSGLTVTFSSTTPQVCTVVGAIVTIASTGTCSITATQGGNADFGAAQPVTQSFAVVAAGAPQINPRGIVDIFSYSADRAVPGSIVAIFGSGFTTAAAPATVLPLPTSLGGVSVAVNGVNAPLFYVGQGQINMQIPWEVQPGTAQVIVTNATGSNSPYPVTIQTAAPAILADPVSAQIIAFNQDGTLNSKGNPTPAGSVVTMYLVGQGPVSNTPATGAGAPFSPLALASLPASVALGPPSGSSFPYTAAFQYLGLTPGAVGLAQANVQVPATLIAGEYQIALTIGGAQSNSPRLWISNP